MSARGMINWGATTRPRTALKELEFTDEDCVVEDGQTTLGEQGLGLKVGLAAVALGSLVHDGSLRFLPARHTRYPAEPAHAFLFRTSKPALLRILFLFRDPPFSGAAWVNEWVMGGGRPRLARPPSRLGLGCVSCRVLPRSAKWWVASIRPLSPEDRTLTRAGVSLNNYLRRHETRDWNRE